MKALAFAYATAAPLPVAARAFLPPEAGFVLAMVGALLKLLESGDLASKLVDDHHG